MASLIDAWVPIVPDAPKAGQLYTSTFAAEECRDRNLPPCHGQRVVRRSVIFVKLVKVWAFCEIIHSVGSQRRWTQTLSVFD
jgi:hypothetical protein